MSPKLPNQQKNRWYNAAVVQGQQLGRTIGYPTLNLRPVQLLSGKATGVYAARIIIRGKDYWGALYYGPRSVLNETKNVLEIHVFDFSEEVYGETILFQLGPYIRPPLDIPDMKSLKKQLQQDCHLIRSQSTANPL